MMKRMWVLFFPIVESEPKCSSNVSGKVFAGDIVSFTCQVQYAGSIAPQMHWSSPISLSSTLSEEWAAGLFNRITGNIHVEKTDDGKTHMCDTFFDKYIPENIADATNKITNTYQWTSEPFIVRCKYSLYSGETCIN